MEVLIGHKMS